jgi:hypothetical protein
VPFWETHTHAVTVAASVCLWERTGYRELALSTDGPE